MCLCASVKMGIRFNRCERGVNFVASSVIGELTL